MKILIKAAALVCAVAFSVVSFIMLDKKLLTEGETKETAVILELWHVDTFEGGTGSRAQFLTDAAAAFLKKTGVYVSVIKHTEESVQAAFDSGNLPDMISFGNGVKGIAERSKPLKTRINGTFFTAGEHGGNAYFYPWAYGRYVLFTRGEGGKTVATKGKNNLSLFALRLAGASADATLPPADAYAAFVSGEYSTLVGTQRDVYRLSRKGVEFSCEPFGDFTDTVQFLAVFSEGERGEAAQSFAEFLISGEIQSRLGKIGLFSPTGQTVNYGVPQMQMLSASPPSKVLNGFFTGDEFSTLAAHDGENDFFEKFREYLS